MLNATQTLHSQHHPLLTHQARAELGIQRHVACTCVHFALFLPKKQKRSRLWILQGECTGNVGQSLLSTASPLGWSSHPCGIRWVGGRLWSHQLSLLTGLWENTDPAPSPAHQSGLRNSLPLGNWDSAAWSSGFSSVGSLGELGDPTISSTSPFLYSYKEISIRFVRCFSTLLHLVRQ